MLNIPTLQTDKKPDLSTFHIAIDQKDISFLNSLQSPEDMGNKLRLLWEPHAGRSQSPVTPTHVTIMANTIEERAFVLYQLEQDRASRRPAGESSTAQRLSKLIDMHRTEDTNGQGLLAA